MKDIITNTYIYDAPLSNSRPKMQIKTLDLQIKQEKKMEPYQTNQLQNKSNQTKLTVLLINFNSLIQDIDQLTDQTNSNPKKKKTPQAQ